MINGYGIFLCAWLFVVLILKVFRYYKTEANPVSCVLGASIQFAIMIWLVFQI